MLLNSKREKMCAASFREKLGEKSASVVMGHIMPKSRILLFGIICPMTMTIRLHFCRRHYGSSFSWFNVVTRKATALGKMMQNNAHYAVQGDSRSTLLAPIECDFLPVNNTNLHHRFQYIADYWSNLRGRQGGDATVNVLVHGEGEPLHSGFLKKLQTSFCGVMQSISRSWRPKPFRRDSRVSVCLSVCLSVTFVSVSVTDRQADSRMDWQTLS